MVDNAIVLENARTDGRAAKSYWDVPHSTQIEGFATDISVDAGERIDFKINVNGGAGSDYKVEIFRLGYYGGDGARKVAEWTNTDAVVQPDAAYDATRALVDAGNWSVTDSWVTPETAVSGVYLARIQRLDANGDPIEGAANQIPFIVREDDRPADIVLQTSDTTWHAYNGWFGNNGQVGANFYGDASGTVDHPDIPGGRVGGVEDRAYAVSYNRPFITRGIEGQQGGPLAGAQDYLFGADYAAIHWLEQNGYDVSYISGLDTHRLGADYLTKYDAFISVGHDEYWTGEQRQNVEEARDAGTNLLFWGGNDVYWKTRWETSIVDGVELRTLVCYKETWANTNPNAGPDDYVNLDPTNIWTGTWRDTRFEGNPLAGVGLPEDLVSGQPHTCNCAENALTGQLFGPDGTGEFGGALDVPGEFAPLRVWRDTSIANGGQLDIAEGILGYEWNTSPTDENRPAGLVHLSETTIPWGGILVDQGNTNAPGIATHNLSLYRAESGALVFGAGTVFWTWALSDEHDSEPYGANIENRDLQQFVINLFADMGIQPGVADAVLASQNLIRAIQSTDTVAATAEFDSLQATIPALTEITLTGTATDDDGNPLTDDGVVALVEVSLDGGVTWNVAEGRNTWSYTWLPLTAGTYDVRVRAIDDSLNMPSFGSLDGGTVEITAPLPPETVSLLSPWTTFDGRFFNETTPLQLGTRFRPMEYGEVTELRYWRAEADASDTDVRTGRLWDGAGNLLATVQFVSDPGETGWQIATLDTPVTLLPGRDYVVTYETLNNYVGTPGFFGDTYTEPDDILSAPGGSNGVFAVGAGAIFPQSSFQSTNYWVDVTFAPSATTNDAPTLTSPLAYTASENTLLAGIVTGSDPEGDDLVYGIGGGADAARFAIDSVTGALTFLYAPDFEAPNDANGDGVYEVDVTVSDIIHNPVTQSVTVTLTDQDDEAPLSTLFGPALAPAQTVTNDPTTYELGTRFRPMVEGEIDALRYWRGAADATDTDERTINLWTASGTLLASGTISSDPGQVGWQTVLLDAPVSVSAGQNYVVSYGTTQNYVVTQNYFVTDRPSLDGTLLAPANNGGFGNGVYNAGATGVLPTSTYLASNYWVDVVFREIEVVNDAPVFTLATSNITGAENSTAVTTLTAADADSDTLIFAIAGGADAARFTVNPTTGLVTFVEAPDFEAPTDANGDNVYQLDVSVSDGANPAVTTSITVTVPDNPDEVSANASTLFGPGNAPAQIVTNDPTDYELGLEFVSAEDGQITSLRYWRGAADADDTDSRVLNLWDGNGQKLAQVTVTSTPGMTGWQIGLLDTPVDVTAGAVYVASYGTTQNYAFTPNFFADEWIGPDGVLSAPSSALANGNGVFNAGQTNVFPLASYNASNYWVDVTLEPADVFAI
ncbi:DUF4082 domain-containing protein [Roseivivax isoporae]|uniref:Cadherin n=1 Tax=Roseivivax isoporae LMG 25204 TaxID=1449351 RepID=X7FBU6_9RHOB|nr:DUF4082 domain-containing protein [Roseivivax isoporae]ETX30397.1 cadherin [Roseivivax isoporae LMG 25204]